MSWLLIGLSALSFLLLLVGFVWVLVSEGKTRRLSGRDVGREIIADRMEEDDETPLMQKSTFHGRAASVRAEASISFSDIKSHAKRGQWSQIMPALMAIAGLLGLLLFGSLALFSTMDDKLVGSLIAVVGVFAVVRVVVGMIRA